MLEPGERLEMLGRAVSALAKNFGRDPTAIEIADRELLEKISQAGGEVSGRMAVVAEKALLDSVSRLKSENFELKKRIESGQSVNIVEASERVGKNKEEIRIMEDCLKSLRNITNPVFSRSRKEQQQYDLF
ncbi:MAG: hypothetical protein AAB830_03145 [Patescibacteria group bacterium]